jgi:hypothetical protein
VEISIIFEGAKSAAYFSHGEGGPLLQVKQKADIVAFPSAIRNVNIACLRPVCLTNIRVVHVDELLV